MPVQHQISMNEHDRSTRLAESGRLGDRPTLIHRGLMRLMDQGRRSGLEGCAVGVTGPGAPRASIAPGCAIRSAHGSAGARPDARIAAAGAFARPIARGPSPVELIVGALVVLGFLAILIRLFPRDADGRALLPRIVDDSIGMWALRRLTGRRLWERPWDPGADLASGATAVSALPAASALSAASPRGSDAKRLEHMNPLVSRPAPTASRYDSTPSRLAAAGVLRVPKRPGRQARVSIGRRIRAAFQAREAMPADAQRASGVVPKASPLDARYDRPPARTVSSDPPAWPPRRQMGVTATAQPRPIGSARPRPTIAGLATVLTFGVIGLVAIAAALAPGSTRDRVTDAGALPGSTLSPRPSDSGNPSASSAPR